VRVISHDLEVEPIFSLLEERYGIELIEAEYELEAALARRRGRRSGLTDR